MDKNILEYFTKKYNTNDLSVIIRFDNGCAFSEYSIKEAVEEFENDLKWFFDMLPNNVRSYKKAFEIARNMYDKKLIT